MQYEIEKKYEYKKYINNIEKKRMATHIQREYKSVHLLKYLVLQRERDNTLVHSFVYMVVTRVNKGKGT